jgi:hypothetical protein
MIPATTKAPTIMPAKAPPPTRFFFFFFFELDLGLGREGCGTGVEEEDVRFVLEREKVKDVVKVGGWGVMDCWRLRRSIWMLAG